MVGRGEASCREHVGSRSQHIRISHCAPETNGVVERFNRSLKYEHLCQRDTAQINTYLGPRLSKKIDTVRWSSLAR